VAVRAEDTKILEAVVRRITVDVVECQRERFAPPGIEAAHLAQRPLEPLADESAT